MKGFDPRRDNYYMRMALSLAFRGNGRVSPNPMVGCVIVDPDGVAGWGYHSELGGPHAEVKALAMAGDRAAGSNLYVNLEPCCHFGRTPPCAPRIAESGVSRIVAGMSDPDPRVSRRGFDILRSEGIEVKENVLASECRNLNRGFISRIERGRPWITLKAAITLDGNMALSSGESKWITNEFSRARSHMLRDRHDAVMVGSGTVLRDDPALTVRGVSGRDPVAVILDSMLRVPEAAKVFRKGSFFFVSPGAPPDKKTVAQKRGCRVIEGEITGKGRLSLNRILQRLASEGINDLLVEGGSLLLGSFIRERLFDEVSLFVSPCFSGSGKGLGDGFIIEDLSRSIGVRFVSMIKVEGDIWLEGVNSCSQAW